MTRFDRTQAKTKRAQALRNDMPGAERKLWAKLKGKQVGGFRFRRQHPVGAYILDFYCPEAKLCIERIRKRFKVLYSYIVKKIDPHPEFARANSGLPFSRGGEGAR